MLVRRRSVDPDQLLLGLDGVLASAPSDETDRDGVFFAAMPAPAPAQELANFGETMAARLALPGRHRPTRVLHVSLFPIGLYRTLSRGAIEFAMQAASTVKMSGFTVGFDRLMTFRHKVSHPLVLCGGDGVIGLEALHKAVASALGLPDDRNIEPHMTLLYGPRELDPPVLLEEAVTWQVHEFVLVRSRYGESRYDILGRWPLR